MAKFGFTDNDGTDVGEKYVTKEYAMDVYPNIFTNATMAGLWTFGAAFLNGDDTTFTDRSSPGTTSGGGTNWRAASATTGSGGGSAIALKNDGTLWTWGLATYGQLGNGSSTASRSSPGTTQGGGTDWAAIPTTTAGQDFHAALKNTGTLWTWGRGGSGRLGSNGTANRSSPVTVVGGITDWVMAACGYEHMLAIRSNGLLYSWGRNSTGQLGSNNTTNRSSPQTVAGASSGGTTWTYCSANGTAVPNGYSLGIKSDGTLWTWGDNSFGKLGTNDTTARSSPGTTSGGGTNWKSAMCGYGHIAAVKLDGTLWTWGNNAQGQLGDGTTNSRSSPGTVAGGGLNWVSVSGTFQSSSGLKADGTLWTWGYNSVGMLGDGSTINKSSPGTIVNGGNSWKRMIMAAGNGYAIREEDSW